MVVLWMLLLGCVPLLGAVDTIVKQRLKDYTVDKSEISVSGISGMAPQFHVAYSASIKGMGSVDGIPYGCSNGHLGTALGQCMTFPREIDVDSLVQHAQDRANEGKIDSLDHLHNSPIYIMAGSDDSFVDADVSHKMASFYKSMVDSSHLRTAFVPGAQHAFPTQGYGNLCSKLRSPYISNCNISAAFEMLNFIHGSLQRPTGAEQLKGKFIEFDQKEFVPQTNKRFIMGTFVKGAEWAAEQMTKMMVKMLTTGFKPMSFMFKHFYQGGANVLGYVSSHTSNARDSLDDTGFAYIPSACFDSTQVCKVHVAFHGCQMQRETIGEEFARHAGYNEVAELNNIIILYPQAKSQQINNPLGCWDWWGYTGEEYDTKHGLQMTTIKNMIDRVTGDF